MDPQEQGGVRVPPLDVVRRVALPTIPIVEEFVEIEARYCFQMALQMPRPDKSVLRLVIPQIPPDALEKLLVAEDPAQHMEHHSPFPIRQSGRKNPADVGRVRYQQ